MAVGSRCQSHSIALGGMLASVALVSASCFPIYLGTYDAGGPLVPVDAGFLDAGGEDAGLADGGATDAGNSCESAGGACVAVYPNTCPNGAIGDPTQYSCGGGVGVACCLSSDAGTNDGGTDGGFPCFGAWLDQYGTCRAPNDGTFPATCCAVCTFGAGWTCNDDLSQSSLAGNCQQDLTCLCLPGYVKNPWTGRCTLQVVDCLKAGGACLSFRPTYWCPNGTKGDPAQYSCGGDPALSCCLSPDAGVNACNLAGGSCVAAAIGTCPVGWVGDPAQYACGGGASEQCCLPPDAGLGSSCMTGTQCQQGLMCCYPCGQAGCSFECMQPVDAGNGGLMCPQFY